MGMSDVHIELMNRKADYLQRTGMDWDTLEHMRQEVIHYEEKELDDLLSEIEEAKGIATGFIFQILDEISGVLWDECTRRNDLESEDEQA